MPADIADEIALNYGAIDSILRQYQQARTVVSVDLRAMVSGDIGVFQANQRQ
jgi:hypothetical protein